MPHQCELVVSKFMKPDPEPLDEATGLPGVRSWRTVYWIVGGIFVLWVSLLTWLTAAYS